jgi:hypothetical protein
MFTKIIALVQDRNIEGLKADGSVLWLNEGVGLHIFHKFQQDNHYEYLVNLTCFLLDMYFRKSGEYTLPHVVLPYVSTSEVYSTFKVQGSEGVPSHLVIDDEYKVSHLAARIMEMNEFRYVFKRAGVYMWRDNTDCFNANIHKNIIYADDEKIALEKDEIWLWKIIDFEYSNVLFEKEAVNHFVHDRHDDIMMRVGEQCSTLLKDCLVLLDEKGDREKHYVSFQAHYEKALAEWLIPRFERVRKPHQLDIIKK